MLVKDVVLSPWFITTLSLLIAFLSYIPSFLSHHLERDSFLNDMKLFMKSPWTLHSSLGALGCCLPLLFHELCLLRNLKRDFSPRASQRIFLLSIVIPSIVIYVTSMTETLSPVLYLCASNSQEILYFGAFLTFLSSSSQSAWMKILSLCSFSLFAIGFLISSFGHSAGFNLTVVGFLGFVTLNIASIKAAQSLLPDAEQLPKEGDRSVPTLFLVNLVFRAFLYSLVWSTGRSLRHAEILPYLVIANTLTVIVIFTCSSVELSDELSTTKLRFNAKRNFIRYISHEMRTPLNCVLIGLELTLSQMKGKKIPFASSSPPLPQPILPVKCDSDSSLLSPYLRVNQTNLSKDDSYLVEILQNTFISCQTAIELLNDSLSYDKLEAEEMKLNISQVPLRILIERCVTPFLLQATQLGIKLNYEQPAAQTQTQGIDSVSPLGDTMVAVDFNRFSQVLRNIISNALKFTSSGGVIDVRVTDHATRAMRTASLSTSTESHCATPKESTEFIRIDISDTGIGMTKEQQESLFKGVVQFADTAAANSNGAGLGLWISKSIVDLHNGMLLVSSDGIPGKGCVFSVLIRKTQLSSDLPLFISSSIANSQHQSMIDEELDLEANHENESHSQAAADVVPEESHTGNSFTWNSKTNRIQPLDSLKSKASPRESDYAHSLSRVHLSDTDSGAHPTAGITGGGAGFFPRVALCVDDSVLNRKLIGRYLEQHFEVLYAVNGLNAVEIVKNSLAEENEIDVILMDNLMPVMDGLEATHQIRELGFKGPIIGITGNCEPEQIDEFIGQGANTVIHKPIQLDHFRKVILDVMGSQSPESLIVS